MGILVKTEHLRRYRDIAQLMVKYGYYDLARKTGLDEVLDKKEDAPARAALQGEELSRDLERMGPTFVKLGQFLSTRPDILPVEYIQALERLQTEVESFPFQQAAEIVETELGMNLTAAFAEFDPEPLAAASIGQVHRATLYDGRPVAVKVQRPGVRDEVKADLEVIGDIARFLQSYTDTGELYGTHDLFLEFRDSLLRELDYFQEKRNLETLRKNLKEFQNIVIPDVVETHTTQRVLTMEFIEGRKITSVTNGKKDEIDTSGLLEEVFRAYLKQILVDGFFHADPHPGNIVLTPNNHIGILDLGMVARIAPGTRQNLIRFLLAVSEGEPRDAANIAASMGEKTPTFDSDKYDRKAVALIFRYQHATLGQVQIGALIVEFTEIIRECGIRVPRELALLGKTLLHLDQVAAALDPRFDPISSVRQSATDIMIRHITSNISPGNFMRALLEMKDTFGRVPRAINAVLEQMARNRLMVKVDAIDEDRLIAGLQKIANRIMLGLLLASLIVGAGLMAGVPTETKIFGYPAVAMILFLVAATGAIALIISILFYDEKPEKRK